MKQLILRTSDFGLRVSSAAPIAVRFVPGAGRRAGGLRRRSGLQTSRRGHASGIPHLRVGYQRPRRHELLRRPGLVAGVSGPSTHGLPWRGAHEQLGHQDRGGPRAAGRRRVARRPFPVLPHRQRGRRLVDHAASSENGPAPIPSGLNPAARLRRCLRRPCPPTKWISGARSAAPTRRPAPGCSRRRMQQRTVRQTLVATGRHGLPGPAGAGL